MPGGAPRAVVLAVGATLALASPALAQPSPAPPVVIDGPSAAISSLGGLSVARDGTGGLVYLKSVSGVPQVFVSALVGGQFQPPVQVDAGLGGASSQPVIAAGNGGVLLIGFINGGVLYVVDRAGPTAGFGAPDALAGGASNPSLQMSNFGKAYLAFTAADGAGHDVRAAYYYNGAWALEGAPLNATPADDAGTGAGAPQVATAGDGVAIVTWGEGGHVYSRRVWGTAPSVVDEQADAASVSGCTEVSAGEPQVSAGGDSSYADVAFQELVSCGGLQQTRVLMNRLQGSQYDGVVSTDGLSSPGTSSADDPDVAMTEYGQGFVTSAGQASNAVVAMELGNNGAPGSMLQINSLPASEPSYPVPGVAGLFSTLVAWQQTPGTAGPAEIRLRYEPRASTLGPEQVLSTPASGPTDAARGLAATGDGAGDAAVAWVQGTAASSEIVVDQLYQAPATASVSKTVAYSRSTQPVLSWTPATGRWGPITYTVTLDRMQLGQTGGSSLRVPVALGNGPHTWYVTTSNPAGLTAGSRVGKVFVDTVPPVLRIAESGPRRAGSNEVVRLSYHDPAPASGVDKLTIRWGDGTVTRVKSGTHRVVHAYRRAGRYRITVTVVDRAGNQTTVTRRIKISKPTGKGG
ncbi:MAG TPA: PKD domain-containing protein [Solirubrobacteraceae bacterium]|nr:PKD domain-containing protein [Solirubrobacteraceae bacterium]